MQVPIVQGSIIMCPVLFSNLKDTKHRPAIILSSFPDVDEIIIAQITSSLKNDKYSFLLEDKYLTDPLPKPSEVRIHKIYTLNRVLIVKYISCLHGDGLKNLMTKIKSQF